MKHIRNAFFIATAAVLLVTATLLIAAALSGCSANSAVDAEPEPEPEDLSWLPEIPVASAPGVDAAGNRKAVVDYSNMRDGYIMVRYIAQSRNQIRALVTVPGGTKYIFRIEPDGDYEVLPLSGGDGEYTIEILEEVEDQLYALALSVTIDVVLENEFAPFLRPNQYVNYRRSSAVVRKAAELTEGVENQMDKIAAIYNYVIENIAYDSHLAWTVQSGYIPDVDAIMESGRGICFDYAALMTAMLRSQSIPTRMVLGYTGDTYHAWISVYAEEMGWVDNMIFFDGLDWKIMDPTFAARDRSDEIMEYIGNPANYHELYQY